MEPSRSKRAVLVTSLVGTILLSSCQSATPPAQETGEVTTDAIQTEAKTHPVTEAVTEDNGVETDPVTEAVTDAPETEAETDPSESLSDHDALMQRLDYSEEERAILAETAQRMSGLRVTYYADDDMTQAVRSEITPTAEAVFAAGDGVRVAVFEGFITFAADGIYALTAPGAANGDPISILEGEHHVRTDDKLRIRARGGTQYGLKLKIVRRDGQEAQTVSLLCNDSTEGFSVYVGRVLLEHDPVAISPTLDIPLRDTYVCVGPDGYYYMTGTTGPDFWDNNYVIHIYRSANLTDWEDLGVVWDFREHATWAKNVSKEDRVPVWAPELSYINGNWYMTYSMGFWDGFCGGILVSTTGKPEGPYTDTTADRLVDNIDGSLFQEDDGTVYFIYKDGLIAPMNQDLSRFTGSFRSLLAADGLPVGFEGCSILKHNGKYYLTAATYNQSYNQNGQLVTTYDSMIAVSDNLLGPYSEPRLLLRNGGHNNLFVDGEGTVWTTLFAPSGELGFHCKPALVPLTEDERGILTVRE